MEMDLNKVSYAQERVRTQGALTNASPEKIDEIAQSVDDMAADVAVNGGTKHKHGGVLNATVFYGQTGYFCRIQCTTRSGRQLSIQVSLNA